MNGAMESRKSALNEDTKSLRESEGTNGKVLYIGAMGMGRGNMCQLHGM